MEEPPQAMNLFVSTCVVVKLAEIGTKAAVSSLSSPVFSCISNTANALLDVSGTDVTRDSAHTCAGKSRGRL